jgi:luciferase family oxidoreductase group 1
MLKLSVLDQSVAIAGRPQSDSIIETLEMAVHAEQLGYHRYWVAEHHNHDTISGSAPEIMMAAIAARTSRIRIGSAGVMLPHYSALKVAEQFRVLDALAPGRIDLGVGRAPGSDGRTAFALNPNAARAHEQFPAATRDLRDWVNGRQLAEGHPFRDIRAFPQGPTAPTVWMLGTSDYGAQCAAHFGMPYCFAHFLTDGAGVARALEIYRDTYQPSELHPEPVTTLCVWALAAETREQADYLFIPRAHWKATRDRGQLQPVQSPEALADYKYYGSERIRMDNLRKEAICGTAAEVGDGLRAISEQHRLDEIVVLTWSHDPAARKRSYELLAGEFGLG